MLIMKNLGLVLSLFILLSLQAPLAAQTPPPDALAVGTKWHGARTFTSGNTQDWNLAITGRDGETFTGTIVLISDK